MIRMAPLKRRVALCCALAAMAFVSSDAFAEGNCPDGYYPIGGGNGGWQGCAPIPGNGSSNGPQNPGPQWATRWGAIATDGARSSLGGAEKHSSKRRAQKAAVAACKQNGGVKCKVLLTYYNQCGVLAWGSELAQAYSAETTEQATEGAIRVCSKNTSNCKVFYTGCSYPERVR